MLIKIYCHTKMYWNLTKPYFHYEVGKWYGAKVNDEQIYIFENCDMVLGESDFKKYFWTQEQFREKQINKIL